MRLRLTLGPDASWQTPTLDPAESEVSASPRKAGGGVASVFNLTVFIRSCKTLLLVRHKKVPKFPRNTMSIFLFTRIPQLFLYMSRRAVLKSAPEGAGTSAHSREENTADSSSESDESGDSRMRYSHRKRNLSPPKPGENILRFSSKMKATGPRGGG